MSAMRAGRLVSLLLLLQTRGLMTAEQLARELEVSVRTIYRDVDALSEAGVPIYADRGPLGGIRLVDGYRTRLTGLTTQEAEALFLSGLPGPAAELGLGTVVTAARLKVLAALPPELRTRASRISQRFHLDAPGWFQTAEQLAHLESLATAVWENRRVEIDYPHEDGPVTRRIDPLGLVLKAGVWYLVARVNGSSRTYRVSRVLDVRQTGETFERPEDFDLASHWSESIVAYERTRETYPAVFRVRREDVEALADVVGMRRLGQARIEPDPADAAYVQIHLTFDWIDQAQAAAFALGHLVDVLEPPELRNQLVKVARAVLARYADGATPAGLDATPDREPIEPVAVG
jgi:predicted DNA-binding transcriptional regulator YafY